ncbi:MAG: HopJ type III effector protein [Gammaproteobacteria bacterium]|jgi:hypothetical protein
MNDIRTFIERLRTTPETIQFAEVIALIDSHYSHTPTAFINGTATNQASENQGSAKVFSFARLHGLNQTETLHCFAEHFRAVSDNPTGDDHQNIRQFIANGWQGVQLPETCLTAKN